ncbi:hypothetical protein ABH924_004419 [Arthrobacter sp. GAS37]|uniref:TNT domain-containing protein n=1 Tax=Arthrobacter sp. GAS37 TaxID=3156261 RepID=UPI0038324A88
MVALVIDTEAYTDASAAASSAAATVSNALSTAASGLNGLTPMAGSDQNGRKWATDYDHIAAQVFLLGGKLQEALGQSAANLGASAFYYHQAEHTNAGWSTGGLSLPAPYPPVPCHGVSTASGGVPDFPKTNPAFEWFEQMVAGIIGDLWPDGDRDKLEQAAGVWDTLAGEFGKAATDLEKITTALAGVSSPEIPKVNAAVADMKTLATSLQNTSEALAKGCRELSGKINYVHVQTEITLGIVIVTVGVTLSAGAGFTVFTLGASDAVAVAAVGGEAAGAAATITGFIAELSAFIASSVGGLVTAGAELIGAGSGVAAIIGTTVGEATAGAVVWGFASGAENTVVAGITEPDANLNDAFLSGFIGGATIGGAIGSTTGLAGTLGTKAAVDAATTEAGLMAGEAGDLRKLVVPEQGMRFPGAGDFGKGFDPAEGFKDHRVEALTERPGEMYGHDANGVPYTRQQARELFLDAQGNPRWPLNDGKVPGSEHLYTDMNEFIAQYGPKTDRIGMAEDGGGKYFAPQGTPTGQRSLDLSFQTKVLHDYEFTGTLPDGWTVESSKVEPAFGQDGGGTQFRILNEKGNPVDVDELKNEGVIRVIAP